MIPERFLVSFSSLTQQHKLQQGLLLVLMTGKCWSSSSRIQRAPLLGSSDAAVTYLDLLEGVVAVDMSEIYKHVCLYSKFHLLPVAMPGQSDVRIHNGSSSFFCSSSTCTNVLFCKAHRHLQEELKHPTSRWTTTIFACASIDQFGSCLKVGQPYLLCSFHCCNHHLLCI
jgi:hypothetical protein